MTDQLPSPPPSSAPRPASCSSTPQRFASRHSTPRVDTPHAPDAITRLPDELRAVGQINDAHGETAADGTIEFLAGSRRRGISLSQRIDLAPLIENDDNAVLGQLPAWVYPDPVPACASSRPRTGISPRKACAASTARITSSPGCPTPIRRSSATRASV